LAIAMAVVYDSPNAQEGSRYSDIWGISLNQFTPVLSHNDIFDFFSNRQNQFVFPLDRMPWPVLVHLVDLDITHEDIVWAQQKYYQTARSDIGALYQTVPYDHEKLAGNTPLLGSRPYTLPNLLQYGGVCGDQAHFTSRVAKCLGIPAMKIGGVGRYGANSSHAWCGYLQAKNGHAILDFTGRYDFDYYYTGDVYDPQTRTIILDRTIEMQYDGLSLSPEKYKESQVLSRAACKLLTSKPPLSVSLACQAVTLNSFNPIAWRVIAYQIAHGTMSKRESMKWSNQMMSELSAHPDLTMDCLPDLMEPIPIEKMAARQRLYNAAFQLYSKRPDLQIHLRLMQCAELSTHGQEQLALQLAFETSLGNAKEGSLILPLIDQIVKMSNRFSKTSKNFNLDVVKDGLVKIDAAFPQKRGNDVSQSYLEYKKMVSGLN
jgi:hypothetical protein